MGFFEGLKEAAEAVKDSFSNDSVSIVYKPKAGGSFPVSAALFPVKNEPFQSVDDRIIQDDSVIFRLKIKADSRVVLSGTGQQSDLAIIHILKSDLPGVKAGPGDVVEIDSVDWKVI